jgi:uncharacterized protein YjiS (DUF1127 family)
MSAPITKSQMAFELPRLSYIDTRWEEPAVAPAVEPARDHGFMSWMSGVVDGYRSRRANAQSMAELAAMSERELLDIGINRGDFERIFDDRFNQDLRARTRRG